MKKHNYIILTVLLTFISVTIFINAKEPSKKTAKQYVIQAVRHPDTLFFAGEQVPLHQYDIKERVDREFLVNTYWQSNSLLLLKRAHKYFPIIEPILARHQIPDDFKYLAVIESGLQNVISPAGAKGFWQLMPNTAKEYNLIVNKNIDERYHLEKSTTAACQYLLKAKNKFGSWSKAAASYNMGMSGLNRKLENQMVNSYYDLLLSNETSRYVPRIIAIKEILSHPYDYGFSFDNSDLYNFPKYKTIIVDTTITDLAQFAIDLNTNYKELKLLNPWMIQKSLVNNSKKEFLIKVKK